MRLQLVTSKHCRAGSGAVHDTRMRGVGRVAAGAW